MQQYIDLITHVLDHGKAIKTRNGIRMTVYGHQMRFDLTAGFPAMTTRKLFWRGVTTELCWFLRGDTNIEYLHDNGVHIWDKNADDEGNVGRIYGYQWRRGFGHDQIAATIDSVQKNPNSTRHVVTAWNPAQMAMMNLPPCHKDFQIHSDGSELRLQFSMRSTDVALGLPFNIASYAILAHLYAHVTDQRAVELICDLGNAHIYEEHIDSMGEQAMREPLPLPKLMITGTVDKWLRDLEPQQFKLVGYQSHPAIDYELIA